MASPLCVRPSLCSFGVPQVQRLLVDADLCLPATPEKPRSPITVVEETPAKEAQAQAQEGCQLAPADASAPLPASWQATCPARDCCDGLPGLTCAASSTLTHSHSHSPSSDSSPMGRHPFECGVWEAADIETTPLKAKRPAEETLVCPGAPIKKSFRGSPMSFRISARRLFTDIPAQ